MPAFELSDYALTIDLVLAVFLALFFALGRPRVWYRDRLGWVIFGYALAVVALLSLIVYGVVFGQRVEEPYRLAVGTALGLALIAKTWSIHRERVRGRLPGERPTPKRKALIMSEKLIPANASLAAKRGFIRTTAQAYGATLTTGISATVVLGVVTGEVELVPTLITLGVALVSPLIAGAASYFSILSSGVPAEYEPAQPETPVV